MNQVQGLYYAFGQLAYAIAATDGTITDLEKKTLHGQLVELAKGQGLEFDYAEIIFQLMQKDHIDVKTAYNWAMREMKLNEYYLSEQRKGDFIVILKKIAEAQAPVTIDEQDILDKFSKDIAPLKGDPVFYE